MKIRGNVVGTNMKPEKIADRIGGTGGGVTEDDVVTIIDNQMDYIAESVIAALPIYKGEVLISFTIDGQGYQAEKGMTWQEWVESDYNTGGFLSDGGIIVTKNGYAVRDSLSNNVIPTEVITNNEKYSINNEPDTPG